MIDDTNIVADVDTCPANFVAAAANITAAASACIGNNVPAAAGEITTAAFNACSAATLNCDDGSSININ